MKKTVRNHILLTVVYFFYTLIFSATCLASESNPKQIFIETLAQLGSLGVHTIGGKSIEELSRQSQTVTVKILPEIRFKNMSNELEGVHRDSGYWDLASMTIYFSNKHFSKMSPLQARDVILHEFLEILGTNDRNFHKSALMGSILNLNFNNQINPGLIKSDNTLRIMIEALNKTKGGASGSKQWRADAFPY